jgi:hypothetical protein
LERFFAAIIGGNFGSLLSECVSNFSEDENSLPPAELSSRINPLEKNSV